MTAPARPFEPGRPRTLGRVLLRAGVPALLLALLAVALYSPLHWWLTGREGYDRDAIVEWIKESRISSQTLHDRAEAYLDAARKLAAVEAGRQPGDRIAARMELARRRQDVEEMLRALGTPPTKMYPGQLPLFPVIYRLEVRFAAADLPEELRTPVVWDSGLPRQAGQYRGADEPVAVYEGANPPERAAVVAHYALHTYHKLQQDEEAGQQRQKWALALGLLGAVPALMWIWLVRRRERERERQQALVQHQIDQAQRLLLEEELRRQEAERMREAAERQALELRSQMFASIGIMAGSYAHNIKNLLVRPNDLLSRCLEADGLQASQRQMLNEVHETLGTVTERLQQILRTVRRDPTRAELTRLDLNRVLGDLAATWKALALDKWKMAIELEPSPEPLWVEADLSHLVQAVENLLFNARDATFEMRNHLRSLAREKSGAEQKKALIAAAAWKGQVTLRCRKEGDQGVVEVQDNGIGMTDEVRRRCLEPHFTTKRDNALYEGLNTGMGLGLSFVAVILERHRASLEIDSEPLHGTTFRVRFPLA